MEKVQPVLKDGVFACPDCGGTTADELLAALNRETDG